MATAAHPDARVVILGGGLTGISAAFHLRRPWLLVNVLYDVDTTKAEVAELGSAGMSVKAALVDIYHRC